MTRILLLIVVIFCIYWVFKHMLTDITAKKSDENTDNNVDDKAAKPAENKMVQCSKCGTHVPLSESKHIKEKIICNNPDCQ